MIEELNAGDLKVSGLVAEEHHGRLRIDSNSASDYLDVARVMLLAECRSYYHCEVCGRPGEHRGEGLIWRSKRCAEHCSRNSGRLIYDLTKTPWRQMSDGRWAYDHVADVLICSTK